jgi:hypothetical protein
MLTLNQVSLLGSLPRDHQRVYGEHGPAQGSFTLSVEEQGHAHTYRVSVPVDGFGEGQESRGVH